MPDRESRTEPPSQRRRQEARQGGQVGKSSDLAGAVVLLGAMLVLYFMGRTILEQLIQVTQYCLGGSGEVLTDPARMVPTLAGAFRLTAGMVLPLMLVVLVLALVTALAQVGWLFTLKPITPSWNKINPVSGLKRMFSARSFMMLVMGVAKTILLVTVTYFTLVGRVDRLAHAAMLSHLSIVAISAELVFTLGIRLALVLLLLGIIDLIYQRYKLEQELKMTKEEVKDEYKRMEGDPQIRRRRRQVQMELALQRIRASVPKADVVITNPTELAVALQYDNETMLAPKVTAKGAGSVARQIRELAIRHRVPIVERKPLAQALYKTVEVGQEIPAQFYRAVAEVLAYVYELAGRGHGRSTAAGVALN